LTFLSLLDGQPVCADSICAELQPNIIGGVPPYKILACSINGTPGNCTDSLATVCLDLITGANVLLAQIIVGDTLGLRDTCYTRITVLADPSAPKIEWRYSPFYPYIRGTIRDTDTGINSITAPFLDNLELRYDAFTPGDSLVKFNLNPINASKPVSFILTSTNLAGCTVSVDPVIARLSAASSESKMTLQVAARDHFFNLENHGLSQIVFEAGEVRYRIVADDQKRGREENTFYVPFEGGWTLDLAELWDSENLQVTLTATGDDGRYAYVIFSDQPWDFTNSLEDPASSRMIPQSFALWPSYPNPFNPSTTIRFDVAAGNQHPVVLKVYNLRGQLVTTLLDGLVAPGEYELVWHGRDNQNQPASSGVYFVVLQARAFRASQKMTLLR
jgi:hypothetical protein